MPQTVISPLPAPDICAPQEQRKFARSAISGSRAALSITVSPSADAAAISIFRSRPRSGTRGLFFSAETVGASAREHAALGLDLCAHKAQGGQVKVNRTQSYLAAAGRGYLRHTEPCEQGRQNITDERISHMSSRGTSQRLTSVASTVTVSPSRSTLQPIKHRILSRRQHRKGAGSYE